MSRVIHFEIHASDPQQLIAFYGELFGWHFQQWGTQAYWLIRTGADDAPGINGGLLPRRGASAVEGQPVNAYVCTVDVSSVEAAVDRAVALNGSIALPRMPIPGVGWLAYVKDPDGNILGVMESDAAAK